jgi:competence protein ComEA
MVIFSPGPTGKNPFRALQSRSSQPNGEVPMSTFSTLIKTLVATAFALLASVSFAAVDVNKANQAELEAVKSIGPAIAGRILEERNKAAFKDWNDMIDRVKGVGVGNAAKFSTAGLTVNGAEFQGVAAAPAATRKQDKPADATRAAKAAEAKPK